MDSQTYTMIGVGVIIALLLFWIIRLEMKLRKLLGKRSGTLDDALDTLRKDVNYLKKYSETATEKLSVIDNKLKKTISGSETVRFNPFKGDGSGSNQSFATAFLNEGGDGVVISSLYSREQTSVYSKPIKKFASEHELSTEEKEAVDKAKAGL